MLILLSMYFFCLKTYPYYTSINASRFRSIQHEISIPFLGIFAEEIKNSTKGGVKHEFSKGKTKEDSKTSGLNHPIHSGSSHIR